MKLLPGARASYLATLAAGVAIGFAVVGNAAAAPAAPAAVAAPAARAGHAVPAAKVVKTATHHYSLAASAFAPDGLHNAAEDYFNLWDPSTLSNSDAGRCFNAGLSLPTGVTFKSVTVYYTAGTTVMFFEISRQDLVGHAAVELASFDTAANTGTPAYTSITKPIPAADAAVNYTRYAYSVGVCPAGNTTFSGLDITYTQPVS
jgi:hypothetical protein